MRQSRDEELVLDLVAYMVSDAPPSSRTEFMDDYYGLGGEDDSSVKRFLEIESLVQRRGIDFVISDFQRTLDEIIVTLAATGGPFIRLLFGPEAPTRGPRYFQVVFLAFHELIVRKQQEIASMTQLAKLMSDSGKHITVGEGGRWGGEQRQGSVDSYVGLIQKAFKKSTSTDPATVHWIRSLKIYYPKVSQSRIHTTSSKASCALIHSGNLTRNHSKKFCKPLWEWLIYDATAGGMFW